jgi:regulator of sigma E protease
MQQLWQIFWTIFFFCGSIVVHEFGHYIAARRLGLFIPRFSIGFGPVIFRWQRKETEFCISLLPLGGYVALPQFGMLDVIEGKFDAGGKPLPVLTFSKKSFVLAMGPAMNVAFAFAIACLLWIVGQQVGEEERTAVVGAIPKTYVTGNLAYENPAYGSELHVGDRICSIDDNRLRNVGELPSLIAVGHSHDKQGNPVSQMQVERDGKIITITTQVLLISGGVNGEKLRILPISPAQKCVIANVLENSPAKRAGLMPGDEVLTCNGQRVYAPRMLQNFVETTDDVLNLTVNRSGEILQLPIKAKDVVLRIEHIVVRDGKRNRFFVQDPNGKWVEFNSSVQLPKTEMELANEFGSIVKIPALRQMAIGAEFEQQFSVVHKNPFYLIKRHCSTTMHTVASIFRKDSEVGIQNMMGMPGIARLLHKLSSDSFRTLLEFVAMLNVGLALINILPIPVLDGGQIMLALLEKCIGRSMPQWIVRFAQNICFICLLILMLYVSALDILRWRMSSSNASLGSFPYEQQIFHS